MAASSDAFRQRRNRLKRPPRGLRVAGLARWPRPVWALILVVILAIGIAEQSGLLSALIKRMAQPAWCWQSFPHGRQGSRRGPFWSLRQRAICQAGGGPPWPSRGIRAGIGQSWGARRPPRFWEQPRVY